MYHKHFSVALTFSLTLNDINTPIHGFITPNYWSRGILQGNFRLLCGNSMIVIQTLFTNLLHHMLNGLFTNCDILWLVYRYLGGKSCLIWCHIWVRKCSLFPEHMISLPLSSSWYNPFIIYTCSGGSRILRKGGGGAMIRWLLKHTKIRIL